ncbi:MAG: DNA (cytosine-5)-methyltransferase 1 [Phormidesmis priestleyi Ana]|uniref:Cytosine-specific methyltransferase n=1 Tax=Phormidesmis priestleyi Ana TaxID=1666911 RepID=A0A0P8C460_9CYAN|nr:MAG: DNA (cytosine-5)-methyltransferase 1 [Phormidesmis priestleyi Ana]
MKRISTSNTSCKQSLPVINDNNEIISCIDLFCGAGGLTHGLRKAGINVIAGIDLDPQCRFPYETNNLSTFIEKDIHEVSGAELIKLFENAKVKMLAGCAPCQPFSTYSQPNRQSRNDNKWDLVSSFGRLVKESKPDLITMENVPHLLRHEVFREFLKTLKQYNVWYEVVKCQQYGVPQTRKRLVLIASLLGEVKLLSPNEVESRRTTVRQAISDLPAIEAGQCDKNDPLHVASSLSEMNLRRIRASKPGGTWEDWDSSLVASCHRKGSGQTYRSVYGRMEWDAPAPTITTQCFGFGNGRFGHPEQDRAISLREAAILQTFPTSYKFLDSGERVKFNILGRLIGNAVPVRLGEIVGRSIVAHLQEYGLLDESTE